MALSNHLLCCWLGAWLALGLIGCSTTPPPPPLIKVAENPEREKYIDKIEYEASEASAALKVAKDGVKPPHSKLVDLTIVRLDGIKPPTPKQIEVFRATLGNEKELKKEEDKAGKVDKETTMLYDLVEQKDLENQSLKEENETIRRDQAFGELRARCFTLGSWFMLGGAGLLVASSVVPFVPKKSGFILLLMASLCFASPFLLKDLLDAMWFKILAGTLVGVSGLAGAYTAYKAHVHVKDRLTSQPDGKDEPVRVTGPQG